VEELSVRRWPIGLASSESLRTGLSLAAQAALLSDGSGTTVAEWTGNTCPRRLQEPLGVWIMSPARKGSLLSCGRLTSCGLDCAAPRVSLRLPPCRGLRDVKRTDLHRASADQSCVPCQMHRLNRASPPDERGIRGVLDCKSNGGATCATAKRDETRRHCVSALVDTMHSGFRIE
jgi:hypothetical protein